ncbi:MAG: SDR family oxidoreductase [Deltaproteobacteria bacterium]|nr:SDR family oxidoreductase [Deltaproteobacteria bacterium]
MALFLTGITGFIGSYVAHGLLTQWPQMRINALVRAKSDEQARQRLWQSLQLHEPDFDRFGELISRIDIVRGDLTAPGLGLEPDARDRLVKSTESVLHIAASLNRKSAKACFNVNLRGTLEIIKIARAAADHHGLRRFSDVSTVAVSGHRSDETVTEAESVDWARSDYDPYARTKKFCEHMVHELLPDVPRTVFRPSTVLGDSRFPQTTQFDMLRAFAALAHMRVIPLRPEWRMDICPANYVAKGIVTVHMADKPRYDSYSLASGTASPTFREVVSALKDAGHKPACVFAPRLGRVFSSGIEAAMSTPRKYGIAPAASLMKVFWPYITNNTVFDNSRIVEELDGERPRPFPEYAYPLLRFAMDERFTYPYRPWPSDGDARLSKVA